MNFHAQLEQHFKKEGIDAFAVMAYADCRETAPEIMRRESFTPKSVILFLVPYYAGTPENISRYAAAKDYHIAIRGIGERLSAFLSELFPGKTSHGYGDHSPIDEVGAALCAGLGIAGDNGLLISEQYGSYVFIGDLVTDIDPELLGAGSPMPILRCEHCGACRRACPTGILRGEGSDCLSAITQRKGDLSEEEVDLMRRYRTVWGCDLCQSACPHNRDPKISPIPFFHEDRIEKLTPDVLASLDKNALRERAFGWRGRAVLERNLAFFDFTDPLA